MPNRLLTYLGGTFASMVAVYVVLVLFTIYLASAQTGLLSSVGDTEAAIGKLEANYYTAISKISAIDPASEGFVIPAHKLYARAATLPTLSRADR